MSVNRWMNWTPNEGSIFRDSPESKPTKPSKPSSVGFDGAVPRESQKIRGQSGVRLEAADSWEWIEERSAIMEIDGGLTWEKADYRAFMEWFRLFVGGTLDGWLKPEIQTAHLFGRLQRASINSRVRFLNDFGEK